MRLSAYMGHVRVSDTYWSLSRTPELFAIPTRRFETFSDALREARYEWSQRPWRLSRAILTAILRRATHGSAKHQQAHGHLYRDTFRLLLLYMNDEIRLLLRSDP